MDVAGRKQYRYHDSWRTHRDRMKFDSMVAFGSALPRLRRRVTRELKTEPLSREQVLACAVRLLDLGFFRIGSEDYAEQNESYGLTTMRREHASLHGDEVFFDYPAKSGVRRVQAIVDPRVREVIAVLKRRRGGGDQLLVYRRDGRYRDLGSDEVNEYLKAILGPDFSAKDFRTWNATVLAAVAFAVAADDANSDRARARAERDAIRTVAAYLGNTPAVARASYVDPRVIDRFHAGTTIAAALSEAARRDGPDLANARTRARIEAAVVGLLEDAAA